MTANNRDHIISAANTLRWELGENFHDEIMESIYKEAGKISRKTVVVTGEQQGFNLDRKIDKIVTSPVWGFPIMFLLLAVVFWLTISGANVPSALLSSLLVDTVFYRRCLTMV